jgi:hypothetical protein
MDRFVVLKSGERYFRDFARDPSRPSIIWCEHPSEAEIFMDVDEVRRFVMSLPHDRMTQLLWVGTLIVEITRTTG